MRELNTDYETSYYHHFLWMLVLDPPILSNLITSVTRRRIRMHPLEITHQLVLEAGVVATRKGLLNIAGQHKYSMSNVKNLFFALLWLSLVASPCSAVTHRKARVRIVNKSGKHIQANSIFVSHKYSDVYKNQLKFPKALANGQTDDANGQMIVDYNTGFLTTGKDWWYITWVFSDTKTIYQTDPNNFRCAIDILEGAGPAAISAAAAAIAGVAACGFPPVAGCAASPYAAAGAAVAAGSISKALLNNEATCGFKQFILRSEDALTTGAWVTITIEPNERLTFSAPSGNAATVYHRIEVLPDGRVNVDGSNSMMRSTNPEFEDEVDAVEHELADVEEAFQREFTIQ